MNYKIPFQLMVNVLQIVLVFMVQHGSVYRIFILCFVYSKRELLFYRSTESVVLLLFMLKLSLDLSLIHIQMCIRDRFNRNTSSMIMFVFMLNLSLDNQVQLPVSGIILSFKYCLKLNNAVVLINVCKLGQEGNQCLRFDKQF